MLGGYSRKLSRRQSIFELSWGNLREKKRSWGAHFQAFIEPKIQILATMVPPPGYTGYITNLPFWVTGRLERMIRLFAPAVLNLNYLSFFFLHCHNFLNIRKELFNHTKTTRWNLLQLNEDQWIKWGSSESYGFTDSSF